MWILYIIALYTSEKILFKYIKIILYLLLAPLIFYRTNLTLLIIFISLLLITNLYISLCNKIIFTKPRIMSYISWIANIKKTNLNLIANIIISLATHFRSHFNYFLLIKMLYIWPKWLLIYQSFIIRVRCLKKVI